MWTWQGTFSDAKGFEGMHDSDSIIPPSGGKTPRTTVPYSSIVRFPRKSGSDRGLSGPLTGSPRAGSGSELPSGQVAGSLWAAPGCHGAFTDSEAAADASGLLARMSLPHIMQRDWELNLDALEVRAAPAPPVKNPLPCLRRINLPWPVRRPGAAVMV